MEKQFHSKQLQAPARPSPAAIVPLRAGGPSATPAAFRAEESCPSTVQTPVRISTPDDASEQQAEQIADAVTRNDVFPADQAVMAPTPLAGGPMPAAHPLLASPSSPLGPHERAFMEPRFGFDFSQVRVHADGQSAASARAVNARAYTIGGHIVFGQGEHPARDRRLLAHELAHVVQQHSFRHDTATPLIQRQIVSDSSPQQATSDPKALIPLAQLIRYVGAVEKAYPSDTPTDLLTRIRVQYYNGAAFESLIPDAHYDDAYWVLHPDIRFSISRTMDKGRIDKVDPDAYGHLTARADENRIGDNPSPYVVMPNGDKIDLGHLLLGFDALLHPRAGDPFQSLGVPNIDPASWVADLGIAAVWMTQHEESGTSPSDAPRKLVSPDLDAYYRMSAPQEDLLGDVDAFGVDDQFASAANQTLSQVLRAYYLGNAAQSAGMNQRWQSFCRKNGFGYVRSGNSITWKPHTRLEVIRRVNAFNDLYGAGNIGAIWNMVKTKAGAAIPRREWPHTPAVVDRFLAWVKTHLEAELNR
jgi:hypothetical protein